jgi:phospholipid/cholesterol/gamma-HCH transport system ATP-binding protein
MANDTPIIRLEGVYKSFGSSPVLRGVDLSIRPGETTVIIGPSGCGKTVLIKHIVALIRPDRGKVFFRDLEISALSEAKLVPIRRRMGFLFQGAALFDSMTVEQNLLFPLEEHSTGTRLERRARARKVLAMVGLDGLQSRYPDSLSGGQKKRVALARAITLDPEVVLYDEPTTGLDPIRADLINELIIRLHREMGSTAIVVTHDLVSARRVGHRIMMLHEGRFIADTSPGDIEKVRNETFSRFVQGKASREELAELESGSLAVSAAIRGDGV